MTSEFDHESTYLSSGIQAETISISTGNPRSYHQAITEPREISPAEIFGKLFIPRGQGPFPVVIVVPGSLGVAPSHINKAEHFTSNGIATCVIDPFGTRGVTSTVANQSQYTFAASAWDVLATTTALLKREEIDATRIGAQGHSRGGTAVLSAVSIAQYGQYDFNLKGIYAAYPWSGHQFLHPKVGQSRIRAVIGERDEWCLPQQVQGHIHAIQLQGGDASFKIFADAQHSFDRDTPVEMIADASVSPGAPTVYIDDDGTLIDPRTSLPDPSLTERDLMLYSVKTGHGRKGAQLGSQGDQAKDFHNDMMAFWKDLFKL
jgi:dienelactone hydrolase